MIRHLLLVILLVGCGTGERDTLRAYREAFAIGDFAKAREILTKAELIKNEKSQLLHLMEEGRLSYVSGDYPSSVGFFNQAIELIDAQYTKSLTREGSKWIVNDASGEYFGSPYERSWLFYHQAMAYLKMYQNKIGEDPRRNLFSARAALLAWDSFFQEWQRATGGKTIYRHDLVAKIVAAQVHEATGIRADQQIALQLYKDGFDLLKNLSPTYASFNLKSSEYVGVVTEKLTEKGVFTPDSKENAPTKTAASTREFLVEKIVTLAQKLRPSDLAGLPAQLGITQDEIKRFKTNEIGNVVFVLEEGVVPPKIAKEINLGVQGLAKLSKDKKTQQDIARIGSEVLAVFAVNILGLNPRGTSSYGDYRGRHALMTVAVHEFGIAFEVPAIEPGALPEELWLQMTDIKGVKTYRPLNVLTHLEDVAKVALEEESSQRIIRTGVRVATKHIVAILGAMAIYKNMSKDGKENPFAKFAAMGSYIAAAKGIKYSERADTRSWQTLPRTLRMGEFALKEGSYKAHIARKSDQNTWAELRFLGDVLASKEKAIFSYSLPQM